MNNPVDPTTKSQPEDPQSRDLGSRFSLALQCSLVMFGCAGGYGGYIAYTKSNSDRLPWGVLIGIPAIAGMLFVLLSELIRSLFAPRKLIFPLPLTLPTVYLSLVYLTATMLTSTGNSLIAPFEQIRIARFWSTPSVLCLVAFSQVVCLSAMAMLKKGPVD